MPFYEYECPSCGYRDEVLQKINDKPLKKCPNCGKKGLIKLMSAPVFRLKGKGWYETDFKSDKDRQRNLAGSDKEEPKSDSKAEAKADAKPDAKVDSSKVDSPKADTPKADTPKAEAAKPAPVKTVKPQASRSAPKAKAARKPTRR